MPQFPRIKTTEATQLTPAGRSDRHLTSFRRHALQRLPMWRPSRQPPSRPRRRPR